MPIKQVLRESILFFVRNELKGIDVFVVLLYG